jgi:lysophospholipase L1-like esterase
MEGFNAATRALARETGGVLADIEPQIPKNLDYFSDDFHYTERGARAVAEHVASAIIEAELVPRHARHLDQ